MRSWNIGLCPACGDDRFAFHGDCPIMQVGETHCELGFFCNGCRRWLILGIREVRGRSEFAWLWQNNQPVLRDDGRKASVSFMTEEKP